MTTPPPLPGQSPEIINEPIVEIVEETVGEPVAVDPAVSCPPPLPQTRLRREPCADDGQMPPTYTLWSLVACLGCVITGIIALVMGSKVVQRWRAGDCDGARKASADVRLMLLASVVLGLINVPFLILYWALT